MTSHTCLVLILAFGMHDLKFSKLFPIANWKHLSESTHSSQACNEAAARYRDNLHVTHAIGMIPGYAFMNGEMWRSAVIHGMHVTGIKDPGIMPLTNPSRDGILRP